MHLEFFVQVIHFNHAITGLETIIFMFVISIFCYFVTVAVIKLDLHYKLIVKPKDEREIAIELTKRSTTFRSAPMSDTQRYTVSLKKEVILGDFFF